MEVNETMNKKFLQFEPAPRRGEPEVSLCTWNVWWSSAMLVVNKPSSCMSMKHCLHIVPDRALSLLLKLHMNT